MSGTPNMMYATPIATLGRYNRQGALYISLIDRQTKKSAWYAMVSDPSKWSPKTRGDTRKARQGRQRVLKKYPVKK